MSFSGNERPYPVTDWLTFLAAEFIHRQQQQKKKREPVFWNLLDLCLWLFGSCDFIVHEQYSWHDWVDILQEPY